MVADMRAFEVQQIDYKDSILFLSTFIFRFLISDSYKEKLSRFLETIRLSDNNRREILIYVMSKIKVTTVEQSKELVKILPIESADLWWSRCFLRFEPIAQVGVSVEPTQLYTLKLGEDDIPGWSAEALISQLPYMINNSCYLRIIPNSNGDWELGYEDSSGDMYLNRTGENLVDVAYQIILDLRTYSIL